MDSDRPLSRRHALTLGGLVGVGMLASNPQHLSGHRQRVLSAVDPIARQFGTYTAYQLSQGEYIGRLDHGGEAMDLREQEYEHNAMAAAKYHPETGELDDSSWRRVDPENVRWQWHVHGWERNGGITEIFGHYEYRPDPRVLPGESIDDVLQRLRDHYNPKWDTVFDAEYANYFLGRACPRIRAVRE